MKKEKHNSSILFGDSLELMKNIPAKSIDFIFADLPYQATQCEWDKQLPPEPLWEQYERIIKDNGAIALTATQPFASMLIMSNLKLFRYDIIWEKTSPTGYLNAKKMPLRSHESILIFYKKLPTYNPQKTIGNARKVSSATHKKNCIQTELYGKHGLASYDSTERYPRSVLLFPSDKQKSSLHPCQKPVALVEYLIKTYSNKGETVLDNVAGSGTLGIACLNTDRNYILMEKEKKYFDIANNRIDNHIRLLNGTI